MPELISDCEKQKQKQRIKTKTKRRKSIIAAALVEWVTHKYLKSESEWESPTASGIHCFCLPTCNHLGRRTQCQGEETETDKYTFSGHFRQGFQCLCVLFVIPDTKKKKTNVQTNSHWPNSINFWPLSALHAHIWHRTGAASYVHEQGMQRSKRSLFRKYIYITL